MAHLQVLCTVLVCFTVYFTSSGDCTTIAVICQECTGLECDSEPEGGCRYGTAKDLCTNRTVCRKGPGERCGSWLNIRGHCGLGMDCRCNRCTGCSQEHPKECSDPNFFCLPGYGSGDY